MAAAPNGLVLGEPMFFDLDTLHQSQNIPSATVYHLA